MMRPGPDLYAAPGIGGQDGVGGGQAQRAHICETQARHGLSWPTAATPVGRILAAAVS